MSQLQSGRVPGQGANTGLHLQLHAVRNRPCLPVYELQQANFFLVRLCSFGSLVLQISLRLPSDLLYRSNCHVKK